MNWKDYILICSCGCKNFTLTIEEDGEIIAKCTECGEEKNIKYIMEENYVNEKPNKNLG